jgi:RNA polymerase sigma factor (sigma-70 family)
VVADDGFSEWYGEHHRRVVAALTVVCGDAGLGRELADEAFVRALERWGHVRAMDNPVGWVHRVGVNLARSRARRHAVERRVLGRLDPALVVAPPELRPEVWAAVRELPPRVRAAVALRYVADLPEREVAAALGVRRGTVARILHDARRTLAERLGDPDDAPPNPAVSGRLPDPTGRPTVPTTSEA